MDKLKGTAIDLFYDSINHEINYVDENSASYAWFRGNYCGAGPTHWWTPAGQILAVWTHVTPAALTPMIGVEYGLEINVLLWLFHCVVTLLASERRDSMLSALYAIANPSVCPSQGRISRKRLNIGSFKFHRTVVPSLSCLRYKFHSEIPTVFPERGRQTRMGWGKRANIVGVLTLSPGSGTS